MPTLIEHLRSPHEPGTRRLIGPSATYQPLIAVWLIDMMLHFGWHEREDQILDVDLFACSGLSWAAIAAISREHKDDRAACVSALRALLLAQRAVMFDQTIPADAPLFCNVAALGELLGLGLHEQFILTFTALRAALCEFGNAIPDQKVTTADLCAVFSLLSQLDADGFKQALTPDSTLVTTGIVGIEAGGSPIREKLTLLRGLGAALIEEDLELSRLMRYFLTPTATPTLAVPDFAHLDAEMRTLVGMLNATQNHAQHALNVLLYGEPGMGKTEFCQLLAQQTGFELLEVAYADASGSPLSPSDRLRAYRFAEQLLAPTRRSILMFDEVEDVFQSEETAPSKADMAQSIRFKAWINRALEQSRTPTIWITNRVHKIDRAVLRRFDFTLEFRNPPPSARRRIAARHLGGLAPSESWLDALASNPCLIPSQFERAAGVAARVDAENAVTAAEVSLRQSTRVLHRRPLKLKRTGSAPFSTEWITTDHSIDAVLSGLRHHPAATMCFYGLPGTGKTAFARHLADALDRPLMVERASDILSPFVGGTEQNIAELFERAQTDDALLLIDEADSFLGDRGQAQHSWEVTQVNELLTQIEEFEGLLVCTTNRFDQMDPASRRRFSHKIRFDPMPPATAWQACREVAAQLGIDAQTLGAIRGDILCMTALTPGDFAVVLKQARHLQETPTAEWLCDALRNEVSGRHGAKVRFGFAA
ncbi:AAA family ATPase [Niveibacterium sp. 24ML]|uniref:AAA family ATPase n=1 Tax=Niveibacterium sp. 24ML TaxID=2985512 RepID=UPI00227223F9|nr:AAA family ATPase [Niveibacterium sp. 24ML]MCX9157809.1 AAA family ATPase [Niveibacterium sp. 24ML]